MMAGSSSDDNDEAETMFANTKNKTGGKFYGKNDKLTNKYGWEWRPGAKVVKILSVYEAGAIPELENAGFYINKRGSYVSVMLLLCQSLAD